MLAQGLLLARHSADGTESEMRVRAQVHEEDIEGDYTSVPGLVITCTRCQHSVEVFGTEAASAQRGAVMLREECPRGEKNFYTTES